MTSLYKLENFGAKYRVLKSMIDSYILQKMPEQALKYLLKGINSKDFSYHCERGQKTKNVIESTIRSIVNLFIDQGKCEKALELINQEFCESFRHEIVIYSKIKRFNS